MNPVTVRTLLEQHHELTDPMRSGNGGDGGGLKLMPHSPGCLMRKARRDEYQRPVWTPAVCTCHLRDHVELDRLIETMRVDRGPLITVADERVSVRALRWHVIHRYLRSEFTHKTVRYVGGNLIGVVHQPQNPASKVSPLSHHQAVVVVDPGNWANELSKQRRKHSRTAHDVRVRVLTWHHDVRLPLVDAGLVWIGQQWAHTKAPELLQEAAA